MRLNVAGAEKDENLGIIRKTVKIGDTSLITPSKSTKCLNSIEYAKESKRINEITKSVKEETITNFHEGEEHSQNFVKGTKKYHLDDCLNLTIVNLQTPKLPSTELTKTLADVIYSASDKVVCLPTVKSRSYLIQSVTPGGNSKLTIKDESFQRYIDFQKIVIDEIKNSNSKAILGMVPFVAPKYAIKLIDMYFDNEVFSFVIDANTSNMLNKEPHLRRLLGHIGDKAKEAGSSISNTYLHAINVGVNNFTADSVSADDFLNFFTYIDVVGTTSKTRFMPRAGKPIYPQEPKKKVFMKNKYSYDLADKLPNELPYLDFKKAGSANIVKKYNEKEQFKEAKKISSMIGTPELSKYVQSKKGITEVSWKKINNIFKKVKIS